MSFSRAGDPAGVCWLYSKPGTQQIPLSPLVSLPSWTPLCTTLLNKELKLPRDRNIPSSFSTQTCMTPHKALMSTETQQGSLGGAGDIHTCWNLPRQNSQTGFGLQMGVTSIRLPFMLRLGNMFFPHSRTSQSLEYANEFTGHFQEVLQQSKFPKPVALRSLVIGVFGEIDSGKCLGKAGFLNVGTTDMLDWIILLWGAGLCILHPWHLAIR